MSTLNCTCRSYAAELDLQAMQELLMEARSQTNDWRYCHIGDLMWGFFLVMAHLNPAEHIRLWHNAQGKLIGYAILGEDPSFDCQVLPAYEWQGVETEALAWAEARVGELRQRDEPQWNGPLVSGARQEDAKRMTFLEQQGFQYRGEFAEVNMLRALDVPIPDPTIPPGYQIRAVEAREASNRADAEREVWLPWTAGNISGEDYARLMQMPGYHRELDVVAVAPNGVIAAYVNGWIDPLNRIGDFGPVGARPAYRRQGLTRAVLNECLRRMKAYGMNRVCVSTTMTNMPARQLYESLGFQSVNQYLDFVKTELK